MIHHRFRGGPKAQTKETIRLIGQAIKRASEYLPIRNHAAMIAATAAPKDYLGQLNAIYDDFISRWRYVRDPIHKEMVTLSPAAISKYMLALDGVGLGMGKGAGDCDCVTVALGAELVATGFPVRIATTAGPGHPPGYLFGHVFPQAHVQGLGWVTVDPVLHPHRKIFDTAPHSRIAFWNLEGKLLGYDGNVRGLNGTGLLGEIDMYGQAGFLGLGSLPESQWSDLSGFLGLSESDRTPDEWETVGLKGFGYLAGQMGIISGDEMNLPLAEVMVDGDGIARTPLMEVSPSDYNYVQTMGQPYEGMLALGDDGTIYQYDGSLGRGFFKRIFSRIKKGVRKVAQKIRKGIRKVISKLPGGKYILKIADKIHKVAMKFVRPLMKFVGKYAAKLAPIAALIPGYGPAIAAGLKVAGKVANIMNKWGVKLAGKKGQARTLVSKDPRNIKGMQQDLAQAARNLKRGQIMARHGG